MNALAQTALRLLGSALAAAALFTALVAAPPDNPVMWWVPGDSPGVPAYARVELPFQYHTAEWAAIVFYRSPDCVPNDFNLLDLFDIPAVFDCGLTVSGFELRDQGAPVTEAPRHTVSSGLAVPVWFVPWTAFQAAIADNVLTKSDLESLGPLKGIAKTFHEVLDPYVPPGVPGGAKMSHLLVTASGVLPDGRTFLYEFTDVGFPISKNVHVRIVIR